MRFVLPLTAAALLITASLPASAVVTAGAPAPAFNLGSNSGKPVALADLKGQVVLVNFWASWCGPCRTEMPILEQINKKYKAMGVTLVGINVEPNSADAQKWLQATPVSFPILFDKDSTVSKLYQVEGMPNTVILDRKGNVRYIHRGYTPGAENEYMDQLRALIREK
jgi:thiol-disulfide isomerase/thioredoxin